MLSLVTGVLRAIRRRGKLLLGSVTILWTVGVFLVSTWQQPVLPSWGASSLWAPAAHALMYLVLALLLVWLVIPPGKPWRRPVLSLATAFALATLYGASLELYQGTVGRDPSWQDGGFNALGAGVGVAIAYAGSVARARLRSFASPFR